MSMFPFLKRSKNAICYLTDIKLEETIQAC